jgi:hypothetical protein
MAEPEFVLVLNRQRAILFPDFAAREELVVAYGEALKRRGVALLRVYSAAIGLCTNATKESRADYQKHRFDVLSYGGEVYGWLREQKMSPSEISTAGVKIVEALSAVLFPRESEVKEAEGNSGGNAEK